MNLKKVPKYSVPLHWNIERCTRTYSLNDRIHKGALVSVPYAGLQKGALVFSTLTMNYKKTRKYSVPRQWNINRCIDTQSLNIGLQKGTLVLNPHKTGMQKGVLELSP